MASRAILSDFRRPAPRRSLRIAGLPDCFRYPARRWLSAVRPRPAHDVRCPAATSAFLLLPLAHLKRSGEVSGSSLVPLCFPFPFRFAFRLPCLTSSSSHRRPSRATGILRLIHRCGGLKWIKWRTIGAGAALRNNRIRSGNLAANEYGLHAMHEGRSYRRAGGGEEEESARPINVSKVLLSLEAICALAVHCAIAK